MLLPAVKMRFWQNGGQTNNSQKGQKVDKLITLRHIYIYIYMYMLGGFKKASGVVFCRSTLTPLGYLFWAIIFGFWGSAWMQLWFSLCNSDFWLVTLALGPKPESVHWKFAPESWLFSKGFLNPPSFMVGALWTSLLLDFGKKVYGSQTLGGNRRGGGVSNTTPGDPHEHNPREQAMSVPLSI